MILKMIISVNKEKRKKEQEKERRKRISFFLEKKSLD